jgi:hypothetical protein
MIATRPNCPLRRAPHRTVSIAFDTFGAAAYDSCQRLCLRKLSRALRSAGILPAILHPDAYTQPRPGAFHRSATNRPAFVASEPTPAPWVRHIS